MLWGNIIQIRSASDRSGRCKLPAAVPTRPARSVESTRQGPSSSATTSQNDPYRIRVPRVTVDPIPPSEAKGMVMCPCKRGGGCPPRAELCTPRVPPPPRPPRRPPPIVYAIPIVLGLSGLVYQSYVYKVESDAKRNAELNPSWRARKVTRRPQYPEQIPESVPYLIIGAGSAGMAAYSAILQQEPCAKVFLVSAEDILPYERPPLSKGIWFNQGPLDANTLVWKNGKKKVSMLYATANEFTDVDKFARARGPAVAVATGWRVTRVDADERTAYLHTRAGEQPLKYRKCLIATGAKPRNLEVFRTAPPEVRERVCRLRTVRDAEVAWARLQKASSCVIVGGGLLASELSWTLGHLYNKTDRDEDTNTVEVVHIMKEKGILRHIIPDYLAEWAAEKLKDEGVLLVPRTEIHDAYISPETNRLSLHLSSGKVIETDYVFACVGAVPNVELAEPSLLEVDPDRGGLLVNTEMLARTDLYVAGDAASVYKQRAGVRSHQQHILDAVQSGCLAGLNMTGHSEPYNHPAHFHVRLGDAVRMEAVGEVSACLTTIGVFAKVAANNAGETTSQTAGAQTTTVSRPGGIRAILVPEGQPEMPCYKKTAEYRSRYAKGIVYYLKDEKIVGIVFWNVDEDPPWERKEVVAEILRAEPNYKDISNITDLLKFHELEQTC